MSFQHRDLAAGRWRLLSLVEQMGNIGSEVERTIAWRRRGSPDHSRAAFERALELLDLTIDDSKNRERLSEITRTREALVDHFVFDNEYNTTDESWSRYFLAFAYAARKLAGEKGLGEEGAM
jgi:hypothetical protein